MADTNLAAIINHLEPVFEQLTKRPHGVGYTLHIAPNNDAGTPGYVFRCAGEPTGKTDSDGNPIIERHVIGIVSKGPSCDDYIAVENPRDAVFTLDSAQYATWDPSKCLCFCGQPVVL